MTSEDIRRFVETYVRAWEREDIRALMTSYAEDCSLVSPMFHAVRGQAGVEASFRELFRAFGNYTITVEDVIVDTEQTTRAALVATSKSTHRGEIFGYPASGRRIEIRFAFVFHFEGGRIARESRLYDFSGLLIQLGVLRAKGA